MHADPLRAGILPCGHLLTSCRFQSVFHAVFLCNIRGFHGGDYEELRLLGCYAVWLL
jgi:hypothetical protein